LIAAIAFAGDVLSIVANERKIIRQGRSEKYSRHRDADGSNDQTNKHALASAFKPRRQCDGCWRRPGEILAKLRGSANPASSLAKKKAAPKRRRLDRDGWDRALYLRTIFVR
jgi:hypothetical protein